MVKKKKIKTGVFIDGSNLTWGSLSMKPNKRWWIDFTKFKTWLHDNYQSEFIQYYGVADHKPQNDKFKIRAKTQAKLYTKMRKIGYEVIIKPLKYIKQENNKIVTKGDVDIELSLGILQNLNRLDKIIIVTGDSDYLALIESILKQNKAVHIISFRKLLSWELRNLAKQNDKCDYWILETLRRHKI